MSFDGYREKEGQSHEKTLPAGNVTFTLLYLTEGDSQHGYTIRYAAMDGTLLGEEAGEAPAGSEVEIEVKEFEGYREIENQSHTVTPVSDGSIFSIKYEAIREDDREEELPVPGEDPGMNL